MTGSTKLKISILAAIYGWFTYAAFYSGINEILGIWVTLHIIYEVVAMVYGYDALIDPNYDSSDYEWWMSYTSIVLLFIRFIWEPVMSWADKKLND